VLSLLQNKHYRIKAVAQRDKVKLRQLISQDLADEISTDVQDSLPFPNDFVGECVAIIRQL